MLYPVVTNKFFNATKDSLVHERFGCYSEVPLSLYRLIKFNLMDSKEPCRGRADSESDYDIKNPFQNFNFKSYLREEVLQLARRQHEDNNAQEHVCGSFRNRVYKFLSIPQYFESFMFYGLLQCLDHTLMVYTFLPLRCFITLLSFMSFLVSKLTRSARRGPMEFKLYATDVRELVKFSFVCICTVFLYTFDSSIAYHEIRTQSIVKIYLFFNLLEVADRLLSAVYLDAIDDVLYTVSAVFTGSSRQRASTDDTQPTHPSPTSSVETVGFGAFIAQYMFALVCLSGHCLLLLAQVTTLNVAFNSQNKSLLTVIISNNFVELKGNVFRKMGKSNLFQIACADVRERFHYGVWLSIIVCRNMSASGWQYDDLVNLLPDILLILLAEVAVDWVKHAFISKFNVIASDAYEEYTVSIAYDLLLCRQGKNASDYFELIARRMGLTPISLSCLINVMLIQTVKSSYIYVFLVLVLPLLFVLKVVIHMVLLNRAYAHVQAYTQRMTAKLSKETTCTMPSGQSNRTSNPPTGVSVGVGGNCDPEEVSKQPKTSMFYPPYTGYDRPTRDEDQFAMPLFAQRRSHSESCCTSIPLLTRDSTLKVGTNSEPGDATESVDEFSSLNSYLTNYQFPSLQHKEVLKTACEGEIDWKFRQFLIDADDMEISHRKNNAPPPLPVSPGHRATSDSLNRVGFAPMPVNDASCFFKSPPTCPLISGDDISVGPCTSSLKASPNKNQSVRKRRRRCLSLNDVASVQEDIQWATNRLTDESNRPINRHVHFPKIVQRRRRLHTENEISSLLIFEQLSSILNDETAHLEDAVDVDLLADDMVSAGEDKLETQDNLRLDEEDNSKNVVNGSYSGGEFLSSDTPVIDQVRQPLSNVDRYSMLGGQIS